MKLRLTANEDEQLRLIDDLSEVVEADGILPEEAQVISNAAREAFEAGSVERKAGSEWLDNYTELREAGWPWRVAVYIAWKASPSRERWPDTQAELASEVLALKSDRVIRTWRAKNPAIDEAVAVMQAAPLLKRRSDIFRALVESATNADHKNHPDRKLALEMLGDYTPRQDVNATMTEVPFTADELAKGKERAKRQEQEIDDDADGS